MPQQTKIFRVFISSTFTDMKQERNKLQRDAFPRLEKFCEENNARFQAVDLRWGVNEESALDQKTLQICFNEIARCQKISPKPNFLILLGDKYGWQPIPEIIPKEEMFPILKMIEAKDKELIEHWYKQDKNAKTEHFVLQPRERLTQKPDETKDELKAREYGIWKDKEDAIRKILRNAVDNKVLSFTDEQKVKYITSATHQEISRGALNPPDDLEHPAKHVFTFSRTIKGLPADKSAKDFIDLVDNRLDEECKAKREKLKKELREKLKECSIDELPLIMKEENGKVINEYELKAHFVNYDGTWNNNELHINDLQKFNNVVHDALKKVIRDQLALETDKDEIAHEIRLHNEFKERLTEHFMGRKEILGTIQNYLNNKAVKQVMSVMGESGSGKSSVMAQAVKLNENKENALVYRFIGATSGSCNIMSLLQSLCTQIGNEYDTDAKTLGREGDEKAWYDINGLAEILKKCLALARKDKPILLFLDSLDQLSETDNAKALHWLPRELPEFVRMVVSSLPELKDQLAATELTKLDVMPEKEAKLILDAWLSSIKPASRLLTNEQESLVINSFNKTQLPIYLKLAFEKAKHWHSYDKTHTLKNDVEGIINEYFSDLEKEYPEDFVKTTVSYMLSGRYMGLAENEILEILAFNSDYWKIFKEDSHKDHRQELQDLKDELEKGKDGQRGYMKIPIAVWSRLYLDIEPFLTERDADGVPIITFFHRQFNEVLRKRYGLPSFSIQN